MATLDEICDGLLHLRKTTAQRTVIEDDESKPGSIFATQDAEHHPSRALKNANAHSRFLVEYAADHVLAFVETIRCREGVPAMAAMTCMRSTLESAATIVSLCDPKISWRDRARTIFAIRINAIREQARLMKNIGISEAEIHRSEQREQYVIECAIRELGIDTKHQGKRKKNSLRGLNLHRMPATSAIRDHLGMDDVYCLLSAVVHGQPWALHQLNYRPVDPARVPQNMRGEPVIERVLPIDAIIWLGH